MEIPETWSLFSNRRGVGQYLNTNTVRDDEKQCLKDPFDASIILSTDVNEKIILFDSANSGDVKVILTDKSIFCIFESNKLERIDLLSIIALNSNDDRIISIKAYSNSFNYPMYWNKCDNVDNVYDFQFILSDKVRAFYWHIIGNKMLINEWEEFFTKNVISDKHIEFYQYHAFVYKLAARGSIIGDTLLLITNKWIYFIFLNCHKISKPTSLKQIKWSFPISSLKSIVFDKLNIKNNLFITILFNLDIESENVQRLSIETDKNAVRVLTTKSFKKFAFIDYEQHTKFNGIIQTAYYDLTSDKLMSIDLCSTNICSKSDTLFKIRKLNPSKTAKKWVRFVNLNNNNGYIEWSDKRNSLIVDRCHVIGISTDTQFLSEQLLQQQSDCYFALICNQRIIAFITNNQQQTNQWLQYLTHSGLPSMTVNDYNFYQYINDDPQI